MKTSNKVLVGMTIFLLLFVICMIIVFCCIGSVPDTLITCVFASCTGELSILGWIKTTKHKYNNKEGENIEDDEIGE